MQWLAPAPLSSARRCRRALNQRNARALAGLVTGLALTMARSLGILARHVHYQMSTVSRS